MKKNKSPNMKNAHRPISTAYQNKRDGEYAELLFMAKATSLGFAVLQPFGEMAPYDFILDADGSMHRVQVKSTRYRDADRYRIHVTHGTTKHRYDHGKVDVLVAYVAPHDAWYVIPSKELLHRSAFSFKPHINNHIVPWEKYREAWSIMLPDAVSSRASTP